METKVCSKCKEEKPLDEFYKDLIWCKACKKGYEQQKLVDPEYRKSKNIKRNQRRKQLRSNLEYREKENERQRYLRSNPERKEKYNQYQKQRRVDPEAREKYNEYQRLQHPKYKIQQSKYCQLRIQTDIDFKLKRNLRSRLNKTIRGDYKTGSAVRDLGCSIEEFKAYLESLFQPGMSWDNYGLKGWHIDHIIPLDSFDLTDPEQLKKACHYTNLQPLWAADNLKKSNRIL